MNNFRGIRGAWWRMTAVIDAVEDLLKAGVSGYELERALETAETAIKFFEEKFIYLIDGSVPPRRFSVFWFRRRGKKRLRAMAFEAHKRLRQMH